RSIGGKAYSSETESGCIHLVQSCGVVGLRKCAVRRINGGGGSESRNTVIFSVRVDVVDLAEDIGVLGIRRNNLCRVQRAVKSFYHKGYGAIKKFCDWRHRTMGYLEKAHPFVGIEGGLRESSGNRRKTIRQRQTGCIIRAGVDTRTRRQLL